MPSHFTKYSVSDSKIQTEHIEKDYFIPVFHTTFARVDLPANYPVHELTDDHKLGVGLSVNVRDQRPLC